MKESSTVKQANEFDGLNRRIIRDETGGSGVLTHFYYNREWQVAETRVGSATSADKQYIYHPNYVDAVAVRYWDEDNSANDVLETGHYYLQDANFNVTAVADPNGTVVERYRYTPYGEATILDASFSPVTGNTSAIGNEYLYTGRRLDPETGLQLNRNRFYASHLGRWVNRDPIGYWGGYNLYEYVNGMPVIGVDPFGLDRAECVAGCQDDFRKKKRPLTAADGMSLRSCIEGCIDDFPDPPPPPTPPLPPCPPKNPGNNTGDDWCSESYNPLHPGSEECFRQVTGSLAGEQCCYDGNGDLITELPGAGTPDIIGPVAGEDENGDCEWGLCTAGHFFVDVAPGLPGMAIECLPDPCPSNPYCFVSGTLVTLADGSQVAIEKLNVGDKVASYILSDEKQTHGIVLKLFSREVSSVITINVGDDVITTTGEHPFYVASQGSALSDF